MTVPAAMPPRHSVVHPTADEYVTSTQSDAVLKCHNGVCNLCHTVGSGLGAVTGSGSGHIDSTSGNVIVADEFGQKVLVLDASCNTIRTLLDPGYDPLDVSVALDGSIAVTNKSSTSSGPGNITFYAPGSNHASGVATGLMAFFYFGAFDASGNFYNDGIAFSGGPAVGIVKKGSKVDKPSGISGIHNPGGIEVAQDGTINIIDQACKCIQIYRNTSHVGTVVLSGAQDPITFALNEANSRVWVADTKADTVEAYPYPQGGKAVAGYTKIPSPFGVGLLPPATP